MQRLLTLILLGLMLVLVACGGDSDDGDTTENDAANNDDTPAQVDDPAADETTDDDSDEQADTTTDDDTEPQASGEGGEYEYAFTTGDAEYRSSGAYDETIEISLQEADSFSGPLINLEFPIIDGQLTGSVNFADDERAEIGGNIPDAGIGQFADPVGSITIDSVDDTISGSFEASGAFGGEDITLSGTFTDIPMINPQGLALQSAFNATVRANNAGLSIDIPTEGLSLPAYPYMVNFREQDPAELGGEGPITYSLTAGIDVNRFEGDQPENTVSLTFNYLTSLEAGEYPVEACQGATIPEDTVCGIILITLDGLAYNNDPDTPSTITIESVDPLVATINANLISFNPQDMENSPTAQATITLDGLVPANFPDLPAEGF